MYGFVELLLNLNKILHPWQKGISPDSGVKGPRFESSTWCKVSSADTYLLMQSTTLCGGGRSLSNRGTAKIAHHRVYSSND